jgi:glycosyltransferase involved in cell wall biosynthesis
MTAPVKRLGIYQPSGRVGTGQNVFGVSVANTELYRALAVNAGLDRLDVLTNDPVPLEQIVRGLTGDRGGKTEIATASMLDPTAAPASGVILRGSAKLEDLAWLRRSRSSDAGYSLMGLIHTIAPPAMRQEIAAASVAPVQAWDALICTSPSVQSAMHLMFDDWTAYLADRFGGTMRPKPQLPLIPLGIDSDRFAAMADRPGARVDFRRRLAAADGDVVVVWVGRLSFFEKAFPQPMMRAVAEAAARQGGRVHLAMAGWFPGGEQDEKDYRAAASAYAPHVAFHVLDGNDRGLVADLWAGADIFISLVDNIQETFGITPIEAMAAGLPVVVSDWDGYRYTVRDQIEGFLIPTLGGPPGGSPRALIDGHALAAKSYQQYVGVIAQHTAVHVGRAADALAALIASPELRASMGAAGRRRVRDFLDWSVVAPQYVELARELTAIRKAARDPSVGEHPVRGEPFRDFAGFASQTLSPETRVKLRGGAGSDDLIRSSSLRLDSFAGNWRATTAEATALLLALEDRQSRRVGELLAGFPPQRHQRLRLTLLWLAKTGVLDWLDP